MDHPLAPGKRLGLWLHLLICKGCRRYRTQIHFLRQATGDHPEKIVEAAPEKLSAEARQRIKQKLGDQSSQKQPEAGPSSSLPNSP